jgi:virginiamycin B lyase
MAMKVRRFIGNLVGPVIIVTLVTSAWVSQPCGAQVYNATAVSSSADAGRYIHELAFSTAHSGPSVVQVDNDRNVWVALARAGKLARVRNGEIREFNLPPQAFPVGIAIDGGGIVWFSDIRRNKIGRLEPGTGAVTDFDVPTKDSWPFFLGLASDGQLWFTERVGNKVGRLNPLTGEVKEFAVPTKDSQPAGLTVTPDGQVYFTENSGHQIGHVDPLTGQVTELPVPSPLKRSPSYGLAGITHDARGSVWFVELDGRLGRIQRRPGRKDAIEEIPLPDPSVRPAGAAVDRWGAVWFTELDGNAISSYNPSIGRFERYPIPTGERDSKPLSPPEATARGEIPSPGAFAKTSRPFGIAVDSNGDVWFSEQYAHKLGVLQPPAVRVFEPVGDLTTSTTAPVFRTRLQAAITTLHYYLDGHEVPVAPKLSLSSLKAGPGSFAVRVVLGGNTYEGSSSFTFNPGVGTLIELVRHGTEQAEIAGDGAKRLTQELMTADLYRMSGQTELFRLAQRTILRDVVSGQYPITQPLADLLAADLNWMDSVELYSYCITVSAKKPHFSPASVELQVGDTVTWSYTADAASGDLTLRSQTRGIEPIALRPGETRSITFYHPATIRYSLTSDSAVQAELSVKPRQRLIYEFPLPSPDSVPGVLAIDPQDNIWFTEGGGGYSKLAAVALNNKIGRLGADGQVKEYETPTPESAPTSIHVGKEGHIWFTERAGNHIGELDPDSGRITEYAIPTPASGATGITVTPDGRIWYASKAVSKVGVFDPQTHQFQEFDTPTPKSEPSTITYDDQGNVWFDERASDKIVRLSPVAGSTHEYLVPTKGSRTVGLVPDHAGHIWFLELGANKVGSLNIESGQITEYSIPTPLSSPFKEALDSAGRLWFTEVFGNNVGMLDNGHFAEFALPTAEAMPGGIAFDSKGNLWFSEQAGNKLAMIPADTQLPTMHDAPNTVAADLDRPSAKLSVGTKGKLP